LFSDILSTTEVMYCPIIYLEGQKNLEGPQDSQSLVKTPTVYHPYIHYHYDESSQFMCFCSFSCRSWLLL